MYLCNIYRLPIINWSLIGSVKLIIDSEINSDS